MTLADKINRLGMELHAEQDGDTTTIYFDNVEQDYFIEVTDVDQIYDIWQNFDIEEEVLMWLEAKKNGDHAVPYITELVEEEKTIDKTLEELAIRTSQFKGV